MIGWWASDKVSLLVLFLMARSYLLGAIELAEGVMLLMITTALQYWSKAINDAVPLPYLVFHRPLFLKRLLTRRTGRSLPCPAGMALLEGGMECLGS